MNRIERTFKEQPVYAAYLTAGDGSHSYLLSVCRVLIESGVNLIEIGLPFSDPIADGPVIQGAMNRALNQGATPQTSLKLAAAIREFSDIPLVLFTYYNPILAEGPSFLNEVKEAGYDGILIVDLPVEEASETYAKISKAGLIPIFIVTPSTSEGRLSGILKQAKGFIYYVLQKGTTGMRDKLPEGFEQHIKKIKELTSTPVLAGFGISNPESARGALAHADGFVVGSALVKLIGENKSLEEIKEFATNLSPRSFHA